MTPPGASLLLRVVVVGLAGLVAVLLLLGAACPWFASLADSDGDVRPPFERIAPIVPPMLPSPAPASGLSETAV